MNSIWHSLLWKEWHEHKWKLVALSAVMFVSLLPLLLYFFEDQISVNVIIDALLACYAILAGLFVGMGVAGKENGRGTVHFLQALPTPMWQPAAAKLVVSSIIVIVPIVLVMAVAYGLFQVIYARAEIDGINYILSWDHLTYYSLPRDWNWYLDHSAMAVLGTVSLLWWMSAGGVNRSDEIRAGAIGFLIIVVIWLAFGYSANWADKSHLKGAEEMVPYAMSAIPGGIVLAFSSPKLHNISYEFIAIIALISHCAVAAWFLRRFGRVVPKSGKGGTIAVATSPSWLGLPRRSQFTAIAWMQIRETAPLALFALAAILGVAAIVPQVNESNQPNFSELFYRTGIIMSFFVVLVAGIGIFLDDLKPAISNFWRSRPVNLPLWFAVKYLSGLLVLFVVLGVPIALAIFFSYQPQRAGDTQRLQQEMLSYGWFAVQLYSMAIAFQCLTRQPLYAAVLTMGTIAIGIFAFNKILFTNPSWSVEVGSMTLALAAAIGLGWLALKNDWGWK